MHQDVYIKTFMALIDPSDSKSYLLLIQDLNLPSNISNVASNLYINTKNVIGDICIDTLHQFGIRLKNLNNRC